MIEVRYGVFCEFAREEANGKSTLIGAFGHLLRFNGPPPYLQPSLALHIYLVDTVGETIPGRLSVSIPGEAEPVEVAFLIAPGADPAGAPGRGLNFNFANVIFTETGTLTARLSLAAAEPVTAEFSLGIRSAGT